MCVVRGSELPMTMPPCWVGTERGTACPPAAAVAYCGYMAGVGCPGLTPGSTPRPGCTGAPRTPPTWGTPPICKRQRYVEMSPIAHLRASHRLRHGSSTSTDSGGCRVRARRALLSSRGSASTAGSHALKTVRKRMTEKTVEYFAGVFATSLFCMNQIACEAFYKLTDKTFITLSSL